MKKALIVIIIVTAPFFVLSALSILLFVCIFWSHRPELSVADILGVCVKEIKSWLRENLGSRNTSGREEKIQ
jgi:hypothetical protein